MSSIHTDRQTRRPERVSADIICQRRQLRSDLGVVTDSRLTVADDVSSVYR